jgi:hypothetical protein
VPLFHIELRNETTVRETLTVERDDHTALREEVARFVGELLQLHARDIWTDEDWQVDVTDDRRLILFTMQISARNTPATQGNTPMRGL